MCDFFLWLSFWKGQGRGRGNNKAKADERHRPTALFSGWEPGQRRVSFARRAVRTQGRSGRGWGGGWHRPLQLWSWLFGDRVVGGRTGRGWGSGLRPQKPPGPAAPAPWLPGELSTFLPQTAPQPGLSCPAPSAARDTERNYIFITFCFSRTEFHVHWAKFKIRRMQGDRVRSHSPWKKEKTALRCRLPAGGGGGGGGAFSLRSERAEWETSCLDPSCLLFKTCANTPHLSRLWGPLPRPWSPCAGPPVTSSGPSLLLFPPPGTPF